MAYREVTMLEIKEVLRLFGSGVPKKRIAAQLGFHAKTVRRYVKVALESGWAPGQPLDDRLVETVVSRVQPVLGRPQGEGWARCEEHRALIQTFLDDDVRLSKIRTILRRQQVLVSYATLRRFAISELGFGRTAPTIPILDCGPGEEVQLDTGWMTFLQGDLLGYKRRFRAWIFTAVRSRFRFVWPCFEETTQRAIEACELAWAFYQGVFKVLIVDNTKAIVDKADSLSPRINVAFLEYAQSRGFVIDTTRVRKPKDKARVERAVQTVRDDCFAGERLFDLESARDHARRWCLEEYGMRRHSRTLRPPKEHLEAEERPALLPPPQEVYDVPLWREVKIARDQHAQVARALYSLPTCFVAKTLLARADRSTVRFYDGATLVKAHPRVPPGHRSTDRHDFPAEKAAYAFRDIDYLKRQAQGHGEAVGRFAATLLEGDLPWTRMRRVYALLGLARRYGSQRVDQACSKALAADMIDIRRLKRLLELGLADSTSTTASLAPSQVPLRHLRPASQYALPILKGEDS
jgi:transposase